MQIYFSFLNINLYEDFSKVQGSLYKKLFTADEIFGNINLSYVKLFTSSYSLLNKRNATLVNITVKGNYNFTALCYCLRRQAKVLS